MLFDTTPHRAVYEKFGDGTVRDISDELPFMIPENWKWSRLTDITEFLHRGKSPIYVPKSGCPMFAQKCNQWDGIHLEKCKFCSETKYRSYPVEYHLHDCDVVINSTGTGTLGRVGLFATSELEQYGFKSIVPDSHVTIVRTPDETLNRFIFQYLRTDLMWKWMNEIADGSTKQKELYTSTLAALLIPIPPTDEQVRIMRKIEKLMPLVEEYGKKEATRLQLDADLPTAVEKSVLQEAIQGKLVPQDPNDEPAIELLKRVAAERKALIKAGKLKRDKGESIIFRGSDRLAYETRNGETVCIQDEIPFKIPDSWEWVRLGALVKLISGVSYDKDDVSRTGVRILRGGNIKSDGNIYLNEDDVFLPNHYSKEENEIHKGDVIIVAATGSSTVIGRAAIAKSDLKGVQIGAFLRIARPYVPDLQAWIGLIFQTSFYRQHIQNEAKGTNIRNLKAEYITDFIVPLPPIEEQKRICAKIIKIIAKVKQFTK